jgi:putative ABC transport system permease protein
MRPDQRDLDEEIRGHLAIGVQERIERGEDPVDARRAALAEFGSLMGTRDSIRAVWRNRWRDMIGTIGQDIGVTLRSLMRARSLTATVVITLALGIGANAAIVSVVREVLLRPLVNRDEDRLVYIRQSAPGIGTANTTFSVPEIADLRSRVTTISAFGDFSTIDFTMVGLGEPRVVKAGVVGGSYFDVMGLRPVLGRLLDAADDGPDAAGAAVLTHRFWHGSLRGDPTVIGRTIRLGTRAATVVGVLEPSVPYPVDTEIIANVVTSSHHLDATMVTLRTHRMTELFGRLAPGATLAAARTELVAVHAGMMREHPEAYPGSAGIQVTATPLRDQIVAPARKALLVLLAAAGLVFVIACSNVANLMLARAVRRESELAIRAALGAGTGALRRALLVETLVLCGAGAVLGVLLARPLVSVLGRYAGRFSVRALDVTVDSSLLWISAGLAMAAAVVLAFVPRLPSPNAPAGLAIPGGGVRITPGTNRRLRVFAITQIALSFVLLAGAGALLAALSALQTANTGYNLRQVLVLDIPMPLDTAATRVIDFFQDVTRRVRALPGVQQVAVGNFAPWRDAGILLPAFPFSGEGPGSTDGEEPPHARLRAVSPGFFAALGVPIVAGRDFTGEDRRGHELVVILSRSAAERLFPEGAALNRHFWWTDPLFGKREPCRIVGIVQDVDDEHVVPGPVLTVYHPFQQVPAGGRLFVRADGDPYALVPAVTRIVHEMSPDQPVERAATLADVRTEVLGPERLNAFVFSVFAGIALLVAVVGVAGVLAFSVSARTHEFGVRLAIGSSRWRLMWGVLSEGTFIATIGIAAGAGGGYALGRAAVSSLDTMQAPAAIPVLGAASVLVAAVAVAALIPAARASRVDVIQSLRAE